MNTLPSNAAAMATLRYLLSQRLCNYGYDRKAWRRIQSQRYRARLALRIATIVEGRIQSLHWDAAGPRLTVDAHNPGYVTGQSQNEEITNLMRRLVDPNAVWVA